MTAPLMPMAGSNAVSIPLYICERLSRELTSNLNMLAHSMLSRMEEECIYDDDQEGIFCSTRQECYTLVDDKDRAEKDTKYAGQKSLANAPKIVPSRSSCTF